MERAVRKPSPNLPPPCLRRLPGLALKINVAEVKYTLERDNRRLWSETGRPRPPAAGAWLALDSLVGGLVGPDLGDEAHPQLNLGSLRLLRRWGGRARLRATCDHRVVRRHPPPSQRKRNENAALPDHLRLRWKRRFQRLCAQLGRIPTSFKTQHSPRVWRSFWRSICTPKRTMVVTVATVASAVSCAKGVQRSQATNFGVGCRWWTLPRLPARMRSAPGRLCADSGR